MNPPSPESGWFPGPPASDLIPLNTPAMLYLSQCVVDAFSPGIAFIAPSEASVPQRANCPLNSVLKARAFFGFYRFYGYFG
jgi:hypothetical protein